ncbi:MAG TPA: hypothetical protein VGX75_14235 [bacterium]|nr:hypothetical protein [bacterium]
MGRRAAGLILLGAALAPGIATAQVPATVPSGGGSVTVALAAGASEITLPAVRALRLSVPTSGLPRAAGPATVSVATDVGAVPRRTIFSLRQVPADVTMDFDLPRGIISVGGTRVGSFTPVAPLTDNLRFPVDVAIHRGGSSIALHRDIMFLLPTVIVPGFSNEKRSRPDPLVVKRFGRYGYTDATPHPTLFWYPYQSHRIGLEEGARALAAYVRRVVLPAAYAAKINVVGYSAGGLFARWLIAYDFDHWTTLVNRLVMVAVPNEGAILPYLGLHAPPFIPFSAEAKTPLARAMDPVFPFWRATASDPWSLPADDGNPELTALNARPFPDGIRVYNLYGDNDPSQTGGPQTAVGVTGQLPGAALSYGSGDGIVLTASALGVPINGSPGLPELAERAVRIDVGRVYHIHVLEVGAPKAAAALQDRVETAAEVAGTPQKIQP